jgi:hypothetical protein
MIYALNPKNIQIIQCKTNFLKTNIGKKLKPNFKTFKLQRFIHWKQTSILKKNQIIFIRNQKKICLLPLCDFFKLIFSTLFEKYIEWNCIISHMSQP